MKTLLILALTICTSMASPLDVARELQKNTYKGFTYQFNGSFANKKVDCTQFIAAVLEQYLKRKLTVKEKRLVLIQGLTAEKARELAKKRPVTDARMKGVAAFITTIQKGISIAPKDAKAGDFIQYWYKDKGIWKGHSAVLGKVWKGSSGSIKASIFGAHGGGPDDKSAGCVGEKFTKNGLNLSDSNKIVFIARLP